MSRICASTTPRPAGYGPSGCSRFDEAIAEVGEPKARLWLLYLTGCSITFERGSPQIFQTVATKRARGPSGLPPTRADLYR